MNARLVKYAQPTLTATAFALGLLVAAISQRLADAGGATSILWLAGFAGCAALAMASYMLALRAFDEDGAAAPLRWEGAGEDGELSTAASGETETERCADKDWRDVATGSDGLRRSGSADIEFIDEAK